MLLLFFHNIIWPGTLADIAFICELIGQECLGQGGYPGVWSTLALIVMLKLSHCDDEVSQPLPTSTSSFLTNFLVRNPRKKVW